MEISLITQKVQQIESKMQVWEPLLIQDLTDN